VSKTISAVYDGQVFRPTGPLDLEANSICELTIESVTPPIKTGNAWEVLDKFTGSIEGPGDWSIEHDHYLYGTPKRSAEPSE
jgi:hypothetical protein